MKTQTAFLRHPLAIVLLLVSLTVIAVSGWWYLQPSPAPPKIEATPEVRVNPVPESVVVKPPTAIQPVALDETATPTTTVIPTEFQWQVGAAQTYRYQSQVNLKIDMGMALQANSAWQTVNSQLSGILNMRIFDHKHDRVRIGFQLSSANFTVNRQVFPRLIALFETFFLVEMSKQGKPLYFHFPRYLNVTNQKFIQEIINSVQVVLPVNSTQAWQTNETHNTGYYQARYQREPNNEVHKHKTDYLTITLQNVGNNNDSFNLSLTDQIHQSDFTARPAFQQSWLSTLTGHEKIDIHTSKGKLASLASQLQFTLSNDPKDPSLAIWQAPNNYDRVLKQFATATGDPTLSQDVVAQSKLDALREHYANTDLTTLVNSIDSLFPEPDLIKAADIVPHIQKLEELLTAYPDQALEMPALLDTLNPSQKLSAYLIGVLEQVGTPQAQQALSTIALNPEPEPAVQNRAVQAIMSFNFIKEPEPQVTETLWQLADSDNTERADTALLAIGSVMSHADSEQYDQVRDALSERLQQSTPAEQPILLKAIGNSGDASFLPEVEPYLTADKSRVRAAAVQAMRGFEDPQVLDHLVNAITTDSHRDVRRAALNALQEREDQSQAVSPLKDYFPQETEYQLQKKLIQFLGQHKQEDPEIIKVLQQQLQQEQDREVKKLLYTEIYR